MNYLNAQLSNLTITFFAIDIALVFVAFIIAMILYVKNKKLQDARYKAKNPTYKRISDDIYLIPPDKNSVKPSKANEVENKPDVDADNDVEHFKNQIKLLNLENNKKIVNTVTQSDKTVINSQPKSIKTKNKKYIEINKNDNI